MDKTNLSKFIDKKKQNFLENFVIPEGLKILKSKIKLKSAKVIPPFDPFESGCDDISLYGPTLDITSDFHTKTTRADYLLYIGVVNDEEDDFLAYGTFCVKGLIYLISKI